MWLSNDTRFPLSTLTHWHGGSGDSRRRRLGRCPYEDGCGFWLDGLCYLEPCRDVQVDTTNTVINCPIIRIVFVTAAAAAWNQRFSDRIWSLPVSLFLRRQNLRAPRSPLNCYGKRGEAKK